MDLAGGWMTSRRARRASVVMAAWLSAWLVPAVAAACPYCAGRSDAGAVGRGVALGAFIFLPFAIVWAVVRFIKSGEASPAAAQRRKGELLPGRPDEAVPSLGAAS